MKKCKNFLVTLIKLASSDPQAASMATNVRGLVGALLVRDQPHQSDAQADWTAHFRDVADCPRPHVVSSFGVFCVFQCILKWVLVVCSCVHRVVVQEGEVEAEQFTEELYQELKATPQPCLVPFLKVLRHELLEPYTCGIFYIYVLSFPFLLEKSSCCSPPDCRPPLIYTAGISWPPPRQETVQRCSRHQHRSAGTQ